MSSALNAWREGAISDSSLIQGEMEEDCLTLSVIWLLRHLLYTWIGITSVKLFKFSVLKPICNLYASCVYWVETISLKFWRNMGVKPQLLLFFLMWLFDPTPWFFSGLELVSLSSQQDLCWPQQIFSVCNKDSRTSWLSERRTLSL